MTDVNEQSFSPTDATQACHSVKQHQKAVAPIWRLRRTLQPVAVVRTIKTQIIPKIVLALLKAPARAPAGPPEHQSPSAVERFAGLALGLDEGGPPAYVEELLAQGASVEAVFLDLLAPAARYLGHLWEADAADFATVTLAMGRLQLIMRGLGERFCIEAAHGNGESVLLTIIPGEQHSFGLSMVAEFFRRAGWNLCTGPFSSHHELTSLVHSHWFDIVGFSVSTERRLDELKRDIHDIRRDSRNRHVGIILGGPMVIAHPELVVSMGADMMSTDAATAPQQAHDLIQQMTSERDEP